MEDYFPSLSTFHDNDKINDFTLSKWVVLTPSLQSIKVDVPSNPHHNHVTISTLNPTNSATLTSPYITSFPIHKSSPQHTSSTMSNFPYTTCSLINQESNPTNYESIPLNSLLTSHSTSNESFSLSPNSTPLDDLGTVVSPPIDAVCENLSYS